MTRPILPAMQDTNDQYTVVTFRLDDHVSPVRKHAHGWYKLRTRAGETWVAGDQLKGAHQPSVIFFGLVYAKIGRAFEIDRERSGAIAELQGLIDEGLASGVSERSMDEVLRIARERAGTTVGG